MKTDQAVEVNEHYDGKDFPAVIYFPSSVVSKLNTNKSERTTHCPIKGDASYWNYESEVDAIWSYENPRQELNQIKNHFGFDLSKGFRVMVKI